MNETICFATKKTAIVAVDGLQSRRFTIQLGVVRATMKP